jgi:sugar O-acyltransferase (sialic acid O-acetyltransferase NeuD family)
MGRIDEPKIPLMINLAPPVLPTKTHKLVIVGAGEFGDIAYQYFTYDSTYEVVAFAVEREFIKEQTCNRLPVVALEELASLYPATTHHAHVAVTFTHLNQVRERLYGLCKTQGYTMANYISSRAFVWHTVTLGDNLFVFEHNTVQHGCTIGNGVVLWSGNHIGHQTVIEPFAYVSSHVVVSGYCTLGARSFIGVNATFADHIKLAPDSFVAMGAFVARSIETPNTVVKNIDGIAKSSDKVSAMRYMKVPNAA